MSERSEDGLVGRVILSIGGEKVGPIDALVAEGREADGRSWARVRTGVLRQGAVIVPLRDAVDDDGRLKLVYEKEHIDAAPEVDAEGDRLSEAEADRLHRHYGLERKTAPGAGDELDVDLPRETRDAEPPGMADGPDNPLTRRRLERAHDFGVPDAESTATSGEHDPQLRGERGGPQPDESQAASS